jgi:hypothetical protein
MKTTAVAVGLLCFASACAGQEGGEEDEGLVAVSEATCLSGNQWQGGNEESALMHPGMSCIACHAAEGEGPDYAVAGTVFGDYDEPDDCAGVDGLTVEITGSDGVDFALPSNAAGNFRLRARDADSLVLPFTARVIDGAGNVREMTTPQSSGDCPSCHTASGAGGAPGRIVAP